jgi:hypothetical protein
MAGVEGLSITVLPDGKGVGVRIGEQAWMPGRRG